MKKWYNVINEKGADTASILIYDIIGGGFFEDGTNAKEFAKTILDLEKEYKNINIRINSPGGSVFEGLGIVNAMYAVKTSESPSAYQAKEFFKNEDNFNAVVEKLRFLLTYGKDSTFQ